ncbi:MAG: FAD-dependent monooxygenase [Pseudonocardiaceae bacterium]
MATIVVAGGGIGGLATALAVVRHGHRAVVAESAERFAELGAGIQLAPNGLHALDALGVGDLVRARAVHMDELRLMDGVTGEHVTSLELTARYRNRFASPYVVVRRAELHRALLDSCRADRAIRLVAGFRVAGYEQDTRSATILGTDERRLHGDVVVGADGVHSAVRRQLVADGEPRVSGITVYRTVIGMERVPEALRFPRSVVWWTGPGCHLVHYPIEGGRRLNLAASRDDGRVDVVAGAPAGHRHVLHAMAGIRGTGRRLLELGSDWRSWTLIDRDPVTRWTDGRAVLLGDAAHPMLHYAAQGACQALEDAVVLGAQLAPSAEGTLPERLARYARLRADRTARIQLLARASTRLWHPGQGQARTRNALLSAMSPDELHDYVAWMHGVRIATGELVGTGHGSTGTA